MAIKRITIYDYDDITQEPGNTQNPNSLIGQEPKIPEIKRPTETPENQPNYSQPDDDYPTVKDSKKEIIGRTVPDLIYAFFNLPQFMATALTVLSFAIYAFAGLIKELGDLIFPGLTALIFTVVWFLTSLIHWFIHKPKKGTTQQ